MNDHYELCSDGPFSPFRDHLTEFGWGVYHRKTGKVFAYVGEKGCAHALSAALNGHWEAAKAFMATDIPEPYFERFKEITE